MAVFVWLFLYLVKASAISALQGPGRHWHRDGTTDECGYDYPPNITCHDCVQGGNWTPSNSSDPSNSMTAIGHVHSSSQLRSKISFDLPLSSQTLLLMARGQASGGLVHVVTSASHEQGSATVDIVVGYDRPELLDSTKACLLSRGEGENGVGLFTPVWNSSTGNEPFLDYSITITFPEPSSGLAPLVINRLETDVVNGGHLLDDLNGKLAFKSVSLTGSNAPIDVKSLTVTKGNISTSNGAITGTFNTTGLLTLSTSEDLIRVAVGLQSDQEASLLSAKTSNGKIDAEISLFSAAAESGGSFGVTAKTSNASVDIHFPTSPINSTLTLTTKTSLNTSTVSLHPAYEGSFSLGSSEPGVVSLSRSSGVDDPSGQGRTRTVECEQKKTYKAEGRIYWGNDKAADGSVKVTTSSGDVTLRI